MSVYDLKSVKLPKLTGSSLNMFTAAAESKALQGVLLPSLMANGGFPALLTMALEEPPTFYPHAAPRRKHHQADYKSTKTRSPGMSYKTIMDYARAYRDGETTPLEVAERTLAAIEASKAANVDMKLFVAVYRENVLEQARASTLRFERRKPLSLLDGVPMAIKDEVDMLPYPTTVGTRFLGKEPAREDAEVTRRLRVAGALLMGKTNMHEIGINPNGFNDAYGAVRNPYNLACDTGGSSSGSAAAVACGIVPAAIGADGGGSIRIPAALCGVVGLKSTFGRVSEFGAAPLCWSVGHLGPLTASVEDTALIYSVIAGEDPRDPNTLGHPRVTLDDWDKQDLNGLTAGIYPEWFEHADPEVVRINYALVEKLKSRGMAVKQISIPDLNAMRVAHAITILAEMAACMKAHARHRKEQGAPVRLNLVIGEAISGTDYLQAQRMRTRAMHNFKEAMEGVDFILTPSTGLASQPVLPGGYANGWSDLSLETEMMRFVLPGNLLGHPSISFPAGYDARGLPVGMQAIGHHWEEHVLLRVAYNAEQEAERVLPGIYFK